jgi:hypothetical protein
MQVQQNPRKRLAAKPFVRRAEPAHVKPRRLQQVIEQRPGRNPQMGVDFVAADSEFLLEYPWSGRLDVRSIHFISLLLLFHPITRAVCVV